MAEANIMVEVSVIWDFCIETFSTNIDQSEHMKKNHGESREAQVATIKETPIVKKQIPDTPKVKEPVTELKYILNELKNLKVAKINANRPREAKRINTINKNVQFEINSAHYFVNKEELMKLSTGQCDQDENFKIEVESKTSQVDKGVNNPASVIKLKVTDLATKFESKVTMLMYHSNQGVHLQGGQTDGSITSCSLAGDFFEAYFKNIMITQRERIKKVKESIMAMDLRRNYAKESAIKTRKKIEKDVKVMVKCPECDYKTFVQTEFKRHTFRMHSKVKLREPENIDKVKPCKAEEVNVHPVTHTSPATTDNTGEQSNEVKPSCLTCRFECNYESELDTHMHMVHQVPRPNPRAVHPDGNHCQDCKTKEDVIMEHIQKVERLELENLHIQTDLDSSKAENKLLTEQKNKIEKDYQEAGRTISQQQRKLTETNEILKTMDSLGKIDGEKRATKKPSDSQEVWEEVWED